MSIVGIVLYTTYVGAFRTEKFRSKQLDLREEVKNKILEEGLYHITSKEAAEKIVESGYILPSKGMLSNHFSKSRYGDKFADFAYMFAGKPTVGNYYSNTAHKTFKDGTIYAVKHTPDKFELNNYTERMEDGAITYEGRCDITKSNPELVRMKIEKGQLIEIPWNEQVEISSINKLRDNSIVKVFKLTIETVKKMAKNAYFIDKDGRLKKCMKKRREEKKMLGKYNNNIQKQYEINKNGVVYTISTIGTKIHDGKILTGYRVEQRENEFAKNIFMDATNITEITEENLKNFLVNHMNEKSIRSEYIGKPTSDGKQIIDEEYAHHFYEKQLMVVKNDETYAKYIEEEKAKKHMQLKRLGEILKNTTAKARNEARCFIKNTKEKGLNMVKDFVRGEDSGIYLGG